VSVVVHAILTAIFVVSLAYQAGPDTSDPDHPQNGPPWYITKPCSVAHDPSNIGYCQQAKAAFACTCIIVAFFFFHFCIALFSCFPTRAYRIELAEARDEKRQRKARWAELESQAADEEEERLRSPKTAFSLRSPIPRTPGTAGAIKSPALNPMTPRTMAFNRLGGANDLPLRNHASSPNAPLSPSYPLHSPEFHRSPLSPGLDGAKQSAPDGNAPVLYFPPPPKVAAK